MSTSVAHSSSPRLATVLLVLAVVLCIVGAASGKRYISNAALNPGPLPGHGHGGVPALAAAVTAGGIHEPLRHHQEASARVDLGVEAPVSVGIGTMSSVNEVRH
jgi:hypothetical protein